MVKPSNPKGLQTETGVTVVAKLPAACRMLAADLRGGMKAATAAGCDSMVINLETVAQLAGVLSEAGKALTIAQTIIGKGPKHRLLGLAGGPTGSAPPSVNS